MIMKIAFIVDQFPALSETFILNQITGLLDRGCEVDIYSDNPRPPPWGDSKIHQDVEKYKLRDRTCYRPVLPDNKLLRLAKGLGFLLTKFHEKPAILLKSLDGFKYGKDAFSLRILYRITPFSGHGPYEIIHCHHGPNGTLALLLKDIGVIGGKLVTTFHGYDANGYPRQYGESVYSDLFSRGDLFTVNTDFTRSRLKALGCPEDKIVKLPVGLKILQFPYQEKRLSPGQEIGMLTVARLVEKKGIEYSIKAVAEVLQRHPNLKYRIVGDGPLRESLQELIEQLDLRNKVELLGWMTEDEVRKLYTTSHLFVLSSVTANNGDQEGQGLVLQEAQAMGMPVVSTLHNGIPEGVLDGKSGFLVPERDVHALAAKLEYLVEHPQVWPEMGRAGREYVEMHYDIEQLNDRLLEIYQRVLDGDLPAKAEQSV